MAASSAHRRRRWRCDIGNIGDLNGMASTWHRVVSKCAAAAKRKYQAYNNLANRRKERNGENVIEINQIMKMAKMKKAAKSIMAMKIQSMRYRK
jgi:hypothetical protein